MILPILEKLKQSFMFGLINIKLNTDLFENENRMYHKSIFFHNIFKIATEVLIIGNKLYLRSVKHKQFKGDDLATQIKNILPT